MWYRCRQKKDEDNIEFEHIPVQIENAQKIIDVCDGKMEEF